jgi:hypothetical protein
MSFQIPWTPEAAAQFQELQQAASAALRQGRKTKQFVLVLRAQERPAHDYCDHPPSLKPRMSSEANRIVQKLWLEERLK